MKKLVLISVMCAFMTVPVFADSFAVGDVFSWTAADGKTVNLTAVAQVSLSDTPDSSDGGAFSVNLVNGSLTPSVYSAISATPASGDTVYDVFETFCVESKVSVTLDKTYWVTIDRVAYSGGLKNSAGDGISALTEWIYDSYLAGDLDGYSDTQVSKAIWYAESEVGGEANALYNLAKDTVGTGTTADHTWVLNLWTLTWNGYKWVATDVQSQLITVPVPAAVLLGFLGLGVAGVRLRKSV